MKKLKPILFLMLIFLFFINAKSANEIELTILFTNDTNGHPLSFTYLEKEKQGGIPARAALIKKIKKENKNSNYLILDAGGIVRGRPESNLYNGATDIAGMNSIGYFAAGFGISEIYESIEYLDTLNDNSDFYFVNSNIESKKNTKNKIWEKFMISKIGGLNGIKVGIFSVITDDVKDEISDKTKQDITILDPIDTSRKMVETLKSEKYKADIIIALTHMGYYPDDSKIGSKTLASTVDGIDIIIDSRTGHKLDEAVSINSTKICQAFKYGLYLGEINLKITDKKITDFKYKLHPVNFSYDTNNVEIPEDPAALNTIKNKMASYNNLLKKSIANLSSEIKTDDIMTNENPFGNLICDSLIDYTNADVAFQNAGGVENSTIPAGEILRTSFDKIIKYDNSVIVLYLTGNEISKILKKSMDRIGKGSFLQVGGITFTYAKQKKEITNIKIKGEPINEATFYKTAINSWLALGGDNYTEFKDINYKTDMNIIHREVLYNYAEKLKEIKPEIQGRINIID